MRVPAPPIDGRTAPAIIATVVDLLEAYTTSPAPPAESYPFPPWRELDPATRRPIGPSAALVGIFARFSEILLQRLNQVPDKNFLAFLDLVGAAQQPPQPARVPLTFSLVAGQSEGALVPAGTKVAAIPAATDTEPVIFEVERGIVATAVDLAARVTVDPELDTIGEWSSPENAGAAFTVFQGQRHTEHSLYVGDDALLGHRMSELALEVTLAHTTALSDSRSVIWEFGDGVSWTELTVLPDSSSARDLTLPGKHSIRFAPPESIPPTSVNGTLDRWLRARLVTPISISEAAVTNMVRSSQLPHISRLALEVTVAKPASAGLAPDLGFTDTSALDLSKEFLPFGERPKGFATFYLASAEAFATDPDTVPDSAELTLDVIVANTHLVPGASSVRPSPDLELTWEAWGGSSWFTLGKSTAPTWLAVIELDPVPLVVVATSLTLRGTTRSDAILTVAAPPVGNPEGGTVRAVPVGGDGRFSVTLADQRGVHVYRFDALVNGTKFTAWTASTQLDNPPAIPALRVTVPSPIVNNPSVTLNIATNVQGTGAATLAIVNAASNQKQTISVTLPLNGSRDVSVDLVEGRNTILVEVTNAQRLAAFVLTVARAAAPPPLQATTGPSHPRGPTLTTSFSDGTYGFSQSGVVRVRSSVPRLRRAVNGQENVWLRARLTKGDYGQDASYTVTYAADGTQGFALIPATFHPPVVTRMGIGYQFTAKRAPHAALAYNQLSYVDITAAAAGTGSPEAPFRPAEDQSRPALYIGYALPPRQTRFPNAPVSAYGIPVEMRYGERANYVAPDVRAGFGIPGAMVQHTFELANLSAEPRQFSVVVRGSLATWLTTPASEVSIDLSGAATSPLTVSVTVPLTARAGDSDRGFLEVRAVPGGALLQSVRFVTTAAAPAIPARPRLAWQYWNGASFNRLTVSDDTQGFTLPGLVEFLAPADFAPRQLFGRELYWLRVLWDHGDFSALPRLQQLLLNTTSAVQTSTTDEVLGSSNGAKDQRFKSTRSPVLAGQRLEIREPEMPSLEELEDLERDEGSGVLRVVRDTAGRPLEVWVRWHEMPDFYGSGGRDRHYVLDHLTGEVRFGNGESGRIPPVGAGNVRLTRYQTGGGVGGNRPAKSVTQLKTTVPFIDRVTNPVAAVGGADAEPVDFLIDRVPRSLRHRDRAVTTEDYEDLAKLSTVQVARVLAVPILDLAADPLGGQASAGTVSLVVVPRTNEPKPQPSLELLRRVEAYLNAHTTAGAAVAVVGPLYVRVDVQVEVAVTSLDVASTVELELEARLIAFLHPLTGGLDRTGWEFGRAPHRSDILALIEAVEGVDHVVFLDVRETEEPSGARGTGRFLAYSGRHTIELVFAET